MLFDPVPPPEMARPVSEPAARAVIASQEWLVLVTIPS